MGVWHIAAYGYGIVGALAALLGWRGSRRYVPSDGPQGRVVWSPESPLVYVLSGLACGLLWPGIVILVVRLWRERRQYEAALLELLARQGGGAPVLRHPSEEQKKKPEELN